jgi:uncharacterized integral membrane protein
MNVDNSELYLMQIALNTMRSPSIQPKWSFKLGLILLGTVVVGAAILCWIIVSATAGPY